MKTLKLFRSFALIALLTSLIGGNAFADSFFIVGKVDAVNHKTGEIIVDDNESQLSALTKIRKFKKKDTSSLRRSDIQVGNWVELKFSSRWNKTKKKPEYYVEQVLLLPNKTVAQQIKLTRR